MVEHLGHAPEEELGLCVVTAGCLWRCSPGLPQVLGCLQRAKCLRWCCAISRDQSSSGSKPHSSKMSTVPKLPKPAFTNRVTTRLTFFSLSSSAKRMTTSSSNLDCGKSMHGNLPCVSQPQEPGLPCSTITSPRPSPAA